MVYVRINEGTTCGVCRVVTFDPTIAHTCVSLYVSPAMGNLQSSFAQGIATGFVGQMINYTQFAGLYKVSKEILDATPGAMDYVFPSERANAVGVWDNTDPSVNNWRFMVYIVWLWKQLDSFEQFNKLKQDRKESLEACTQRLLEHIRNVELEEGQA